MKPSRPRGHPWKKQKGNNKSLATVEPTQAPCPGPSHGQHYDSDNADGNSDTGALDTWDPHMGLKPSALDDCGSDANIDLVDNLPYGAECEVSDVMVDLIINLNDCDVQDIDWLPPREQQKLAARKTGMISFAST